MVINLKNTTIFFLSLSTALIIFNIARADDDIKVFTVKNVVKKNEILKSDNIEQIDYNKSRIGSDIILKKQQAENLQALRNLRPGMILKHSYLRIKPEVSEGSQININYAIPGIKVESTGIAMQDGSIGDIIDVMNQKSRKVIKAKVIAEDLVSVN